MQMFELSCLISCLVPDESLHQIQAWSISFLLYSTVQRLYRKYNAMEMWKQEYKDAEGVKEMEHDDVRKIIEDIRKARDYSRQASVLSVAAIVICAITLIIRLLTA